MKLNEALKTAQIEREVEDIYNNGLTFYFLKDNETISHLYNCDGLITKKLDNGKFLKLIIEYKFDEIMSNRIVMAKVLIQVIYYIKQFELNGEILPNVIMAADKNECFVIHANDIIKYLDYNCDWNIAPSNSANKNPQMIKDIAEDENINPFIFDMTKHDDFKIVADKIIELASNIQRFVRVTEHNISTVFEYFLNNVIKNYKKIDANELVSLFIGVIIDHDNYYQHPSNKNIIIAKDKKYEIYGDKFKSFFSYFERKYTPQEKMKFTEISDRLIEDTKRRFQGAFFTPTIFVDYAHKMISEQFGEDWKEKYVVWDNCCGSCNLTRDYKFKELYCSTLEQSELDIASRYNTEAVKFQYDFLNDDQDDLFSEKSKLPEGLVKAFEENKPIIFFMNPPYGTSATFTADKQKDESCCKTIISNEMKQNNMDLASRNFIPQFLYRICKITKNYNLTNVHLCMFVKPNFECANSFVNFRKYFLNEFYYNNGILFCANEFDGVSNKWGIAFEIWHCGKQINCLDFKHDLVKSEECEIKKVGTKIIYNCDGVCDSSQFVRETPISNRKIDFPVMSSGIKLFENTNNKQIGQLTSDFIGCYYHVASDVYNSATYVALFSGNCSHPSGKWSITKNNFNRIISTFTARKCINGNWINDKDVFMKPNVEHPSYAEYEADSIIYSLFNNSSNQSSLRNITYKGKQWNIYNHFFWMSKDEIIDLANKYHNDFCYNDARTDKDRYTYEMIKQYRDKMSPYAKMVLVKAIDLTIKSFEFREIFNQEHSEYQINNWDCGYYQLKPLWKQYFEEEFAQFRELYKRLTEKLRPQVYELGFLK